MPSSAFSGPQGRSEDEPLRLLSVGPIDRERGTIEVLSALESVRGVLPSATLVLCGEGPMAAEAQGLPGVEVIPPRSGAGLASLLSRANLFLTNDRADLIGMETLRALSAGLPALVPHGSAAAEHVQPVFSGLLHDGTAPSITAVIKAFRADPRRFDMGELARRQAQETTVGMMIAPAEPSREPVPA